MSIHSAKNHLSNATSPYLQQHADNPVQWYPWGPEALQRAREENKPILLSIGYSACHWCHVMAHESFEDEQTADLMNRLFINIKVDREERPDLDKIYQTAHQLLTQRNGGWPLTMFLMPQDHVPFFGGTYFPPEARYNMPSFRDVMINIEEFYRTRMPDLEQQNESVRAALASFASKTTAQIPLDAMPLDVARQQLQESFDERYAGFGAAPKFPHPTNLESLLTVWAASRDQDGADTDADEKALHMATQTLHAMASGGMYDQVGGGFYRYSVDERWEIPHFEKMLYDNGPLLSLYCQAFRATQSPVFKRIARETADWVIREMQSPEGAYYSTLDADSEGEEGRFYVWTTDEVQQVLGEGLQFDVVNKHYGLDGSANFEGKWHFNVRRTTADIADELDLDEQSVLEQLAEAKQKLFEFRKQRTRPGRDEKILTSWNGLMIKGMVEAGRVLNDEKYIDSAVRALDFIRQTLWVDNRLLATCKDGKAHLTAYLDDYVMLADAVLTLLQARWRSEDLTFVVELVETVLQQFEDKAQGGFFFTASDHEQLLMRLKPYADDALPSGNGVAASVLLRLGHLLGETRYTKAAQRVLEAAWEEIAKLPYIHNALLMALGQFLFPGVQMIIRMPADQLPQWQLASREKYAGKFSPQHYILAIANEETALPEPMAEYKPGQGAVAYVCKGFECRSPVSGMQAALALLD